MSTPIEEDIFEQGGESDEIAAQVDEYDLTSSPNDFNVSTIYSFIESGSIKIPAFQRNYVWDIKRASRLIESLIIGLPVPQIFLYEEERNSFLVVDGQQRLMTIYYFIKGRFPRNSKRAELREIFDTVGVIPEYILNSNEYFTQFALKLPNVREETPNKFSGLTYATLASYKTQFELRTIRNIIVKQVKPSGDHSSIYEMFNRLNTGGTLLTPQEIRASLYHSEFLAMLSNLNLDSRWRDLIRQPQPDLHMRDVELLLRAVAVWREGDKYQPSVATFLNKFAAETQLYGPQNLEQIKATVDWFLGAVDDEAATLLRSERGKLVVTLFEAVFAAAAEKFSGNGEFAVPASFIESLTKNNKFREASDTRPTDRKNVIARLDEARRELHQAL